jgi:hypothetical protein
LVAGFYYNWQVLGIKKVISSPQSIETPVRASLFNANVHRGYASFNFSIGNINIIGVKDYSIHMKRKPQGCM